MAEYIINNNDIDIHNNNRIEILLSHNKKFIEQQDNAMK